LPIVQDKLAHTLWKSEHLTTVHHHHGDNHAEQEVAEAEHEEKSDSQPATSKTSEPVSVHTLVQILYTVPQLTTGKQKFAVKFSDVLSVCLDKHYPPPKSC
jgi:hypothetical protein